MRYTVICVIVDWYSMLGSRLKSPVVGNDAYIASESGFVGGRQTYYTPRRRLAYFAYYRCALFKSLKHTRSRSVVPIHSLSTTQVIIGTARNLMRCARRRYHESISIAEKIATTAHSRFVTLDHVLHFCAILIVRDFFAAFSRNHRSGLNYTLRNEKRIPFLKDSNFFQIPST